MRDALSKACDISSLLYNSPLNTYYPSISTTSQINYTKSENTEEMLVIITPVVKKVPGMDFPINHEMYPNDCENIACTKIGERYRPGSWVIVTNEWDNGEDEFSKMESYICVECSDKCKKSFNGSKILRKKEAEPVLKEKCRDYTISNNDNIIKNTCIIVIWSCNYLHKHYRVMQEDRSVDQTL